MASGSRSRDGTGGCGGERSFGFGRRALREIRVRFGWASVTSEFFEYVTAIKVVNSYHVHAFKDTKDADYWTAVDIDGDYVLEHAADLRCFDLMVRRRAAR